MATGVILGFPIIRAVVRRIDRGTGSDRLGDGQALRAEIEHLRSQLEALEERAEFTERLLAQERDRRQVGAGRVDRVGPARIPTTGRRNTPPRGDGSMEGILAIVFIFGGGSMFLLAISPVGKAIAARIQSQSGGSNDQFAQGFWNHTRPCSRSSSTCARMVVETPRACGFSRSGLLGPVIGNQGATPTLESGRALTAPPFRIETSAGSQA